MSGLVFNRLVTRSVWWALSRRSELPVDNTPVDYKIQ